MTMVLVKVPNIVTSFLSLSFLSDVLALSCYYCASNSASVCNSTQKIVTCPDANSVCLTIKYTEDWVGKQVKYFDKKCVDVTASYGCQQNCDNLEDAYDCKPFCCAESLCNKEVVEEIIWYGLMSSDSSTAYPFKTGCLIGVFIWLMICWVSL